jgi:hypothetical protein
MGGTRQASKVFECYFLFVITLVCYLTGPVSGKRRQRRRPDMQPCGEGRQSYRPQLIALILGFTPPRFMRSAEFEIDQLREMGCFVHAYFWFIARQEIDSLKFRERSFLSIDFVALVATPTDITL